VTALAIAQTGLDHAWMFTRVLFTSLFANIVVVGLMGCSLLLAFGALMIPVNGRSCKTTAFYGVVGCGVLVVLSASQLGAVPVSFKGIADLGLLTLPPNDPATMAFDGITSWVYGGIAWIAGVLVPLGVVLIIAKVDWGWKAAIMGMVMSAILALVGTGSLFTVIAGALGIDVPLVG